LIGIGGLLPGRLVGDVGVVSADYRYLLASEAFVSGPSQ
jgi:hypothetical protein